MLHIIYPELKLHSSDLRFCDIYVETFLNHDISVFFKLSIMRVCACKHRMRSVSAKKL